MTKNTQSTRYYSHKHEDSVAKLIGGTLEANSGAAMFSAGDVCCKAASLLCECKTCMKDQESFSIKKEWLDKNQDERKAKRLLYGCLAFNFGPDQKSYFVIDERLMKILVSTLENEEL